MKTIKLKGNALSFFLSFFLSLLSYTLDAQLYVTSSGNVGIGINNPAEKLRVVGNTSFTGTTSSIASAAYIRGLNSYSTQTTPDYTWWGNDRTGIFHPAADNIGFTTLGIERMRINSAGRIGIGTSSPYYGMIEIKENGIYDGICLNDNTYSTFRIALVDDKVYLVRGGVLNNGIRINQDGHIGINGYASSTYWFYVTGDCRADSWSTYSDSTAKKDIVNLSGSEKLLQLRPVSYRWKEVESSMIIPDSDAELSDAENSSEGEDQIILSEKLAIEVPEQPNPRLRFGFLAQEVKEIYPDIVTTDNENGSMAIEYDAFIPLLVDGYQKLVRQIDSLNSTISKQQEAIDKLSTTIIPDEKKSMTVAFEDTPQLFQNIPNPFKESTIIKMFIPEAVQNAHLNIYNLQGTQLKTYIINDRENCEYEIRGFEFNSGIYLYTLILDGMALEAKKMILTD
ncbi:MAG: tail fiber domain-containing protein [Bacteroidales bacterium]|nr:tail fiber domain-containing protein [Bacteroidales bacterium]MCF8390192.1 tail fiber domain-containing protein [Bacteroidales bacterium]